MIVAPETPYGKEVWKWDHFEDEEYPHDETHTKGMRKRSFQPYPKMLYIVGRTDAGKLDVTDQRKVGNADEEARAIREGFALLEHALHKAKMLELEIAKAAAERAYGDRRMSPAAQAEAAAAEDATAEHLPSIPEKPIVRRGRRPKVAKPDDFVSQ